MRLILLQMLDSEHSQAQMKEIVNWIGNDQKRFDTLINFFLTGDYRTTQRASWSLSNCAVNHPALIKKHYKALLSRMKDPACHVAVRRNVFRIFDLINIPQKLHGELMTECIKCIENPNESIAVQAFSIGILDKLTKFYPDIRHEVETILEARLPNSSKGFRSRALKYLSGQKEFSSPT